MNYSIENYKELSHKTLIGQFDVKIIPLKFKIKGCKWGRGPQGKEYILWPATAYEKDGQKKFYPHIEFDTMDEKNVVEGIILQMLRKY